MKYTILFLSIFLCLGVSAQITFNAPVAYTTGVPANAPSASGSRIRVDLLTNKIYQWQPTALTWQLLPHGIAEISGCSAPAYTPTVFDGPFAINKCTPNPELYYYFSGSWKQVGGTGGGSGTVTDFVFNDGNGFDATVTNSTTTPTVSLATTVTGIIQGSGGALSAVTVGGGLTFGSGTLAAVDQSTTNELNTAFTVTSGNLRLTDAGGNLDVAVSSIAPVQAVAAGTGISISGTTTRTITNTAPDQTVSITGDGISAVTGTYPNFTVTSTEVDGSLTNEGILGIGAGSGTSSIITSNTSGATGVTVNVSTGLSISETTNTNGGQITLTNSAPDQTVSITGAGINAVTGTYPNFTITGTEVDGSISNELQTVSTGTNSLTLSNGGGTVTVDTDPTSDLTTSTSFSGDVSGTYDNMQLGTGVVGSNELESTAVAAGSYGSATQVPQITVDTDGRVTAAASVDITVDGNGIISALPLGDVKISPTLNNNIVLNQSSSQDVYLRFDTLAGGSGDFTNGIGNGFWMTSQSGPGNSRRALSGFTSDNQKGVGYRSIKESFIDSDWKTNPIGGSIMRACYTSILENQPTVYMYKSQSNSFNTPAKVTVGRDIGAIAFASTDTTVMLNSRVFTNAASGMSGYVYSTFSYQKYYGGLRFWVTNGSQTLINALEINTKINATLPTKVTSTLAGSAALEVSSTTGGFVMPRMTTAQRDAITGKVAGTVIFNTTTSSFQGWDGSSWVTF